MTRLPAPVLRTAACVLALASVSVLSGCGQADQPNSTTSASQAAATPAAAATPPEFATCAGCHSVAPGAPQKSGPNLHGIIGRKAGAATGYSYSKALRDSGIVWTPETLDSFLAAPAKMVPGTRMTIAVASDKRRQAIIAYLAEN